jgi:hypothetical protein
VPCASRLYAQPPEGSEGPVLPLKALAKGFEVILADLRVLWIFVGVGQRHEDHPPLERPEGSPGDVCETKQEVPSACPGETPYPVSHASTVTLRRTELILSNGFLEGECGYRSPYGRGDVGNALM